MFDKEFFETTLPAQVGKKAKESAEPTLIIQLLTGQDYSVNRIVEVGLGWIALMVYPPGHKSPRKNTAEDRKAGAPLFDLDVVMVPFGSIGLVVVTTERQRKGFGYTQ